MYKTLAIEITIISQVLANTLPVNKTYAALVKEKGEIFKQINEAIQESIVVLKKNNDTEAVLGIEYMNQLKEQLKEINGTDMKTLKNDTNIDTRRRNKITLNMAEIAAFLDSKNDKKAEEKRILAEQNKAKVQKELDAWLVQQELENAKKVKKKKKKLEKSEECPRWGVSGGRKKKKVADRRQDGGPTADKEIIYIKENCTESDKERARIKKRSKKYPCCRKCCKKSYMGCL